MDFVRVRDPQTGHHLTMTTEEHKLFGGEVLKQDAVDAAGNPLPPKYSTSDPSRRSSSSSTATAGADTTEA